MSRRDIRDSSHSDRLKFQKEFLTRTNRIVTDIKMKEKIKQIIRLRRFKKMGKN